MHMARGHADKASSKRYVSSRLMSSKYSSSPYISEIHLPPSRPIGRHGDIVGEPYYYSTSGRTSDNNIPIGRHGNIVREPYYHSASGQTSANLRPSSPSMRSSYSHTQHYPPSPNHNSRAAYHCSAPVYNKYEPSVVLDKSTLYSSRIISPHESSDTLQPQTSTSPSSLPERPTPALVSSLTPDLSPSVLHAQCSDSSTTCSQWHATVPTLCERSKIVSSRSSGLAVLPLSWDIGVSIYRELARLIHRLPFHKRLVVCLVFRGHKFKVDLGEVKAAGVACLIGLGLSLGTLLLYRLYFRIIVPFLNSVWAAKGKHSLLDDEYTLHLEDSESEVDVDTMGNNSSKRPAVPSVFYSRNHGVSVGSARPPSLYTDEGGGDYRTEEGDTESCASTTSGVRLRPCRLAEHIHRKSPSPASDKDSAIGGTEMSQSLHSELSNRDSFYSSCTAESGFDDLGFLEELRGRELRMGGGSPGGSMRENFSPGSLRERNIQMLYRAHHGHDAGLNSLGHSVKPGLDTLSDCSSERSGVVSSCSIRSSGDGQSSTTCGLTNRDPLLNKMASKSPARTISRQSSRVSGDRESPHLNSSHSTVVSGKREQLVVSDFISNGSSPFHTASSQGRQSVRHNDSRLSQDLHQTSSHDLEATESIRSFNSSAFQEDIDWNLQDNEDRDMLSTLEGPLFHQSMSDIQFKQSLMQRIQEWSSFAEEYNKSRDQTPNFSPVRYVRRSRSLDRHIGDPGSILVSDEAEIAASRQVVDLEPTTERNLETLEYELHDIQGEFESITSKLHELIEQGTADMPNNSPAKSSSPQHQRHIINPAPPQHNHLLPQQLQQSRSLNSSPHHHHHQHRQHMKHQLNHHHQQQHQLDSAKLRRLRTRWERVPSSACSTSSRGSRASSIEFAWDLADYTATQLSGGESVHASPVRRVSSEKAPEVINIATPIPLDDYAQQEWKGDTDKAKTIRQGYGKVPTILSCQRLAVVRGDNYCGLRSVLFQVLSSGLRVTRGWSGIIGVMDSLHNLYSSGTAGLDSWSFAQRLPSHCTDRLASLSKCMLTLYATIEEVCNLPTQEEREKRTICLLNTGATFDLELMEGLKVMMLLTLADLHSKIMDGAEVPIFSHLLFARDSSATVSDFLQNHLNAVGDTGGLEQVEMCLLAYALGVKVRVLRLAQLGQQDFDCVFPEDAPAQWPTVSLIAEDDRHYNVPLP